MSERCEVQVECVDCDGTGLFQDFRIPKGVAVVCFRCTGSGEIMHSYIPFLGRKPRNDIRVVRKSLWWWQPIGDYITYEEFFAGKMP